MEENKKLTKEQLAAAQKGDVKSLLKGLDKKSLDRDLPFEPDIITVAYGTNDWSQKEASIYIRRCTEFYEALCANYPNVPIFAITPIWRLDSCEEKKMGAFENTEKFIREVCASYKNVTVVNGLELFPRDTDLFADGRLHPNDKGFECYFENLYKKVKEGL